VDELVSRIDDDRQGRQTIVRLLGPLLSGRVVAPLLVGAIYALIVAAVVVREAVSPGALVALLTLGLARRIIVESWTAFADPGGMLRARANSRTLHLLVGLVIAVSSLCCVRG